LVKVVRCVHSRPASPVYSELHLIAVQNLLCWLACYVHNGPPSLKFQYSLGISSLGLSSLWCWTTFDFSAKLRYYHFYCLTSLKIILWIPSMEKSDIFQPENWFGKLNTGSSRISTHIKCLWIPTQGFQTSYEIALTFCFFTLQWLSSWLFLLYRRALRYSLSVLQYLA
jgi:hypothetical protein